TSEAANAMATVTVTGGTMSLTKTPDKTSVCNGDTVTYTYVVTNNSDAFTWTGSLTDDTITLPAGAASFSIPAGQSKTFTASAAITEPKSDVEGETGAFSDPAITTTSRKAKATTTGHAWTISVTKTPDKSTVCNGDTVTYTYVVTNNSDAFTWTGSLTDDTITLPAGAASFSIPAGQSKTFTASAAI